MTFSRSSPRFAVSRDQAGHLFLTLMILLLCSIFLCCLPFPSNLPFFCVCLALFVQSSRVNCVLVPSQQRVSLAGVLPIAWLYTVSLTPLLFQVSASQSQFVPSPLPDLQHLSIVPLDRYWVTLCNVKPWLFGLIQLSLSVCLHHCSFLYPF